MLELKTHKKFEKAFQRDRFSGGYNDNDFAELSKIIGILLNRERLDKKYKDHSLKGEWRDFRECHIKPDWLLVYKADNDKNSLILIGLGTHSQIFNR